MSVSTPTSPRPYLLRALHEWISDSGYMPHLIVDAQVEGVQVPREYVRDGRIVLNISHTAVHGLTLGNDTIEFDARFAGVRHHVRAPVGAVLGIYARETGQGMAFENEPAREPPNGSSPPGGGGRAHLKIVK